MSEKPIYHPPTVKLEKWHEQKIGCVTDTPGNMRQTNKTGGWRTFRPVVDKEKCNKCGLCWIYCPDACMSEKKDIYEPDLEFCKGCGICAEECGRGAIKMELEG